MNITVIFPSHTPTCLPFHCSWPATLCHPRLWYPAFSLFALASFSTLPIETSWCSSEWSKLNNSSVASSTLNWAFSWSTCRLLEDTNFSNSLPRFDEPLKLLCVRKSSSSESLVSAFLAVQWWRSCKAVSIFWQCQNPRAIADIIKSNEGASLTIC